MQAVILAAGKGTRMQPLTLTRPKQLVEVAGKPLIEHIVSSLPEEIDEIILVIGYLGDMIIKHCGNEICGRKVQYVWQHEALGTAHALEQAKDLLHGSFLLMYGDDLVDGLAIKRALKHKSCLLAYEHPDPRAFGVIEQREDGLLKTIREKPENPASNLVSASGIVLHTDIFEYYDEWPESSERYVTHALNRYAKHNPVHVERLSFWQPINSIEQLKEAEQALERL
jgi:bifunctional UDP-N-acetylglucosamine pyrophosphorylase/glucosamine-1-phosphate N-acetyltransferase